MLTNRVNQVQTGEEASGVDVRMLCHYFDSAVDALVASYTSNENYVTAYRSTHCKKHEYTLSKGWAELG